MFCSQCGHSNPENAAFCTACGSALTQDTKTATQPSHDPGLQNGPVTPQTASFSAPDPQTFAPVPPYSPQGGFTQMPYPAGQLKKKRTGLIACLIVGVIVIAVAAVALFVWPGVAAVNASGVAGYWVSEARGEAIELKSGGSVRVYTTYNEFKGNYEFDSAKGLGVITVDDLDYAFAMTEQGLKIDGMGVFERAEDGFDADDFIDDMSDSVKN